MNPPKRRNRGTPANVDENFVGFEDFIVDHDCAGRLKAGMALDDRAILESPQPFLDCPARASGNFVLACLNKFYIDAYIAIDIEPKFGAPAGNMGHIHAGNHRLGREASRIYASAAKLVAFNNGDGHARG